MLNKLCKRMASITSSCSIIPRADLWHFASHVDTEIDCTSIGHTPFSRKALSPFERYSEQPFETGGNQYQAFGLLFDCGARHNFTLLTCPVPKERSGRLSFRPVQRKSQE